MALISLLAAFNCAVGDQHGLDVQGQPNSRHPNYHDEMRAIQWGDLNFLHTTDTHGWLAGHILERQFSADWGDFVSFSEHARQLADSRGVDLIMVDSGDRHDGNGLSDASKHDGSKALPIFCAADYDVVTIGNHELYRGVASRQEFRKIREHFGEKYVVSNVEIAVGHSWVPMGEKYRLFTTKNQKRKILALGFLFNFEGNDKQATRVTKVEDELEKQWFKDVEKHVLPQVDHVVVAGHIPVRDFPEFLYVLNKIRAVSKHLPVSFFGGHSHIRDYKIFDNYAVGLQSGRYCETIGWASVNLTSGPEFLPNFSRSYIDFNPRAFAFHVDQPENFLTERGHKISNDIKNARKHLDLDAHRADVPQNYYTDRAPFPSSNSLYTLIQEKVLPLLTSPKKIRDSTRFILLNTGAVRFDLFKGPYTKDTGYILSPFKNEWFYISKVPRSIAEQILPIINGFDRVLETKSRYRPSQPVPGASNIEVVSNEVVEQSFLGRPPRASYGYRTVDDLGDDGDSTVHRPWTFYPIPNAFQTVIEAAKARDSDDDELVSLVFHDFVAWFVEKALNQIGRPELFKPKFHGGEELIDLLPQYFNSQ